MPRRFVILPLLMLTFVALPAAQSDDEDPTVLGKKASEWLEMLRNDKEPKRRRAALIVLEQVSPKVRGVLTGVCVALERDEDEDIRVAAAQLLGRMWQKVVDEELDGREAIDALAASLKKDKAEKVREASALS